MSTVELKGIPPYRLAGFLSTVSLYRLVPNCEISFEYENGLPYPVLHSDFSSTAELARYLTNFETHDKLGISGETTRAVFNALDQTSKTFSIDEFLKIFKYSPEWAMGTACDAFPQKKGDKKAIVRLSEFRNKIGRRSTFLSEYLKYRNRSVQGEPLIGFGVISSGKEVKYTSELKDKYAASYMEECLKNPSWSYTTEWIPDAIRDNLSIHGKNPSYAYNGSDNPTPAVVPIFFLAMYAWTLYPCWNDRGYVGGLGVHRINGKKHFYYPVWNRPIGKKEFMTLAGCEELTKFGSITTRKFLEKIGVTNVFRCLIYSLNKGSHFSPPVSVL